MKTTIIRSTLIGILMLGLTIPGVASARFFSWGCPYQGTWFGVTGPEDTTLAGWMVTVEGKSNFFGTNNLEDPTLDPRISPDFSHAVRTTTLRGNWMRTGFNNFAYTTMGFAVDANFGVVYIAKLSGRIRMSENCRRIHIKDNKLEVFAPGVSPFYGKPVIPAQPYPDYYGYRAYVDLP